MATPVLPETAHHAHAHPTYHEVTRDIAATIGSPKRGYFILLGFVLVVLAAGAIALLYQIRYGLGVAGYSPPVMWAVYITTFVFWGASRTRAR